MHSPLFSFKNYFTFLFAMLISIADLNAQQDTFDIVTYTPPAGYTKEIKKSSVVYTYTDKNDKSWCQIAIYESTKSLGSIEKDFDIEWKELLATPFKITKAPQKEPVTEADGWKIMSGSCQWNFKNKPVASVLTTCSGSGVRISFIINTSAGRYMDDFEKFATSIDLHRSETPVKPTIAATNNKLLIGTWGKGNSVGQAGGSYGRWSYTKEQYIFNSNGTYSFARKVYREDDKETFLTREKGTFSINGNSLSIVPASNVIEAWSKKNGGDNFNQLISRQNKPLEKTTYQFSVQYEAELKQTSLLLVAAATQRDGSYNATTNNSNAWRYGPTPPYTPIKLPD